MEHARALPLKAAAAGVVGVGVGVDPKGAGGKWPNRIAPAGGAEWRRPLARRLPAASVGRDVATPPPQPPPSKSIQTLNNSEFDAGRLIT